MCGIAGIYGAADELTVSKMVSSQIHRGPDGSGVWSNSEMQITLGHCRLSIIGLSTESHQPMSYANDRIWISFNGEIYNYKELRLELKEHGFIFRSNSDTEVILAAYLKWGKDCIKRLRGMFAFALVDTDPPPGQPELLLVRDRFGIKPLLYFEQGSKLYFASELRSLLESDQIARNLDPDALLDFLAFGSVNQPSTIISGVKAIPAAHWMEVFKNEVRLIKYWDLHENTKELREELLNITFTEASKRLRELLYEATTYNLVSDVPVGAFLSGGIDSTAVVGLMSSANKNRIKTFSVGFDNTQNAIDERKYARRASNYLNTEHKEVIISSNDALEIFERVVAIIDQPSIDGTNTWVVSRASKTSVKVALSGLGGDEIFAGYPHFYKFAEDNHSFFSGSNKIKKIIEKIHSIRPNYLTLMLLSKCSTQLERLTSLRRVIENFEIKNAVLPKWNKNFQERILNRSKKYLLKDGDVVQQISYFEINNYLQNTLLRDGDVMSMSQGLEVRPVLLDHLLVEFVYSLPMHLKLSKGQSKKIFIESVSEYIPEELQNRKKMGFEMPFVEWMTGPLKTKFNSLLKSKTALKLFSPFFLDIQLRGLNKGKPEGRLWALCILIAWIEENNILIPE